MKPSKVLIIAPHPDDEVLGCGGTIARHSAAGDQVRVVVVTRGAGDLYAAEEVDRVREELGRAHEVLGVDQAYFLDFPAPRLDTVSEAEVAAAIQNLIQSFAPDTVYVPHSGDIHIDHRISNRAALVACRPRPGVSVRTILAYETLSETEWHLTPETSFAPNVFIDVSEYLELKLSALKCYGSQLREPPHPRSLETVRALARYRGATVGISAAEAFVTIRRIVD